MASPSMSTAAPTPQRTDLEMVPPSGPGRSRWPFIAVAILLMLGVGAWQLRSRIAAKRAAAVPAVKTVKAVRGVLQQTLRVTGSVTARNFSNVFAPIVQAPDGGNRGLVLINLATNGGMVKEGDLVAKIDGQSVQDHLDDVESQVYRWNWTCAASAPGRTPAARPWSRRCAWRRRVSKRRSRISRLRP